MSVLKNFTTHTLATVSENELVRRRLTKAVFVSLFIASIDLFISPWITCYHIICFGPGLTSINVFCAFGFSLLGIWIWLSVDCLEKRILFRIVRKLFKTKKSCPLSTRREKMFLKFIQSKYWYNCFKTLNRIRDHNDFDNDNKM